MKIIHTGDLHLYSKLESHLDAKSAKLRKEELLRSFLNLADYATNNNIKVVIIAGDMFDVAKVDNKSKNSVLSIFNSHQDITFLYCKGNHDEDSFFDSLDELPSNLKMFSDTWEYLSFEDVTIAGINFNNKSEAYLYNTLDLKENNKNIVVMHGDVTTTTTKEKIQLKKLINKNIDYLCLGHIHQNGVFTLDDRGVYVYCGCLEARGFDEEGPKGFYVIDSDDITHPTFINTSIRTVHKIEVEINNCLSAFDYEKRVFEKLKNISSSDMVEIIITGKYEMGYVKDNESLKARLNQSFFFGKVKDLSTLYIDPNSYKNDKSIKGEFIRSVLADDSINEDDKAKIIEYGIHSLTKEEL